MFGRGALARLRGTAKIDGRDWLLDGGEAVATMHHTQVLALKINTGLATQNAAIDGQELIRHLITLVMAQKQTIGGGVGIAASGHDIDDQTPIGEAVKGGCLASGQGRRNQSRAEGDNKAQILSDR